MLLLAQLGVLVVVRLVKVTLVLTMAMETVATRREVTSAVLAMVMSLDSLGIKVRRGSLNITQMTSNGDSLSNLGDAVMFVIAMHREG